MIDAVILSGGLGQRLRPVLSDRPKPLAEVDGRPFLEWLVLMLEAAGVRRIVLATGYMGEVIEQAMGDGRRFGLELTYSREPEPLGTAGALRLAADYMSSSPVLVLNGDSYCRFELGRMLTLHRDRHATATMWLQREADAGRFGSVELDRDGRIVRFLEKAGDNAGLISCGVYLVERAVIERIPTGRAVSLERDVFPGLAGHDLYGVVGNGTFLDIGTPQALAKADNLLHKEFTALQTQSTAIQRGRTYLDQSLEVQRRGFDACLAQVVRAADAISHSLRAGGRVLLCGNGGSAADCQHIATELVCRLSKTLERPAISALALTTDTSVLTAFGNDSGFEGVFARQVEAHGRKGDVLIAISTSGNSSNVVRAVETARKLGLVTVGLLGEGGRLTNEVEHAIVVPDRDTQHVQETLLPLEHLLCDLVETTLYGTPEGGQPRR
jgi:phosphoheptose isomerase/UTP-glucose-1-phosphate uridylyltransferase